MSSRMVHINILKNLLSKCRIVSSPEALDSVTIYAIEEDPYHHFEESPLKCRAASTLQRFGAITTYVIDNDPYNHFFTVAYSPDKLVNIHMGVYMTHNYFWTKTRNLTGFYTG